MEELAEELLSLMDSPEERLEISALSQKKAKLYQPDNILGQWVQVISDITTCSVSSTSDK